MPLYEFERISTGERHELFVSYDEKLNILKDPDMKEVLGFPGIIGGRAQRPDSGFRDVLKTIRKNNIGSGPTIETF